MDNTKRTDKVVGFRQYLKSASSYEDLKELIEGQTLHFNPKLGFVTIIAICGENPSDFLKENNLYDNIEFYPFSAWEEKPEKVAKVFQKSVNNLHKVQIIHYSDKPEGLTYPLELLVWISKAFQFEHLSVSDSDFQLPYSEIRRTYDYHLNASKKEE